MSANAFWEFVLGRIGVERLCMYLFASGFSWCPVATTTVHSFSFRGGKVPGSHNLQSRLPLFAKQPDDGHFMEGDYGVGRGLCTKTVSHVKMCAHMHAISTDKHQQAVWFKILVIVTLVGNLSLWFWVSVSTFWVYGLGWSTVLYSPSW